MKLSEIAIKFGGRVVADGCFDTLAFGTSRPGKPFLTFLEKDKFLQALLENEQASCVLTREEYAEVLQDAGKGVLICKAPRAKLFEIHNNLLQSSTDSYAIPCKRTTIGQDCQISPLAYIAPNNVTIGDRVTVEPFAVIRENVTIKNDCIIHANAVIGGKGFSFAMSEEGERIGIHDGGEILLEELCEVFELAQISTPPFPWEKTILSTGVKLDAQTHVGHGAHIGAHTLVAEGGRVCGNARIGSDCWIGVGAIVSNRVSVGDRARVSLGAVVTKDVPAGTTVSGNFAIEHQRFLKNLKQSLKDEDE